MKNRVYSFLLTTLLLFSLSSCSKNVHHNIDEYILELETNNSNSFNILQLNDIHLAAKDNRDKEYDYISRVVNEAKKKDIGLIVINGDLFSYASKKTVKEVFELFDSFEVPWTFTFGNHDAESYFSVNWLTSYLNDLTNSNSYCIFKDIQDDDVDGNSNFAINIVNNDTLLEQVIIMDSNTYDNHVSGYDCIKSNQISWYSNLIDYTTNTYGYTESIMFFHIPIIEYKDAIEEVFINPSLYVIKEENNNYEEVSSPKIQDEFNGKTFYEVIKEKGSTKSINVAHDHNNNFVIDYQGIYLGYGIKSSYRDYYDESLVGGRIISISNINEDNHTYSFEDIIVPLEGDK